MIASILDRHIGRAIAHHTLLVLAALTALLVFVVFVDVLGDYGRGNFGLYELLRFVVLSQPRKIYELFPVAVLIGTLMGLSTLAANAELIAMRAAGVSKTRVLVAVMKTGVLFAALAVVIGEVIVPAAESAAQSGRAQAMATGFEHKSSGVWMRDGRAFVNVGEVLPDLSLLQVAIYEIDAQGGLRAQIYADRARFNGDAWELYDARETVPTPTSVVTRRSARRLWHPGFTPEVVAVFSVKPEALSLWQLRSYIQHLRSNGQETARYELARWQKLLLPGAIAILAMLAVPFVFRPARSGGLAQRIFIGVLLGLSFVVIARSFGYAALLYGIPPLIGAVLPLAAFLLLAVALARAMH